MSSGAHETHLQSLLESQLPRVSDLGGAIAYVRDGSNPGIHVHSGSAWGPVTAYDNVTVIANGDGVTDVTSIVAAAVASAYSGGHQLYWPAGTYLTSSSLANFHSVTHRGPGIVKRGSTLFYVDPSSHTGITNNLYVATTGNNTNDGLGTSQPRLTVQSMADVIFGYTYGDITWKVQIAAGTYVASTGFTKAFPSPNRVQFLGAAVSDGTVPTTIFDSPGGAGQYGLSFFTYANIYVEDIKFTNYKDGGAVAYSGNSYGINAHDMCNVYIRNCHASVCDTGINMQLGTRLRMQAGLVNACAIGLSAYSNVCYTIGYNGTAADVTGGTGPAFTNCVTGLIFQEMTTGHMDYTYISGHTTGVIITISSRCLLGSSTVTSNTTGVAIQGNSMLSQLSTIANTFTSNTSNVVTQSGSVRSADSAVVNEDGSIGPSMSPLIDTATYQTQSASPVTVLTHEFFAKEFEVRGSGFELEIDGEVSGTANTKTIVIALEGTTLLTAVIASGTLEYTIHVKYINRTAASSQKLRTIISQNGVAPVVANTATAIDLTAATTLTVTHQVTNVADRNDIVLMSLNVVH